jgi:nitrite reductase/ring-hydroxylating ferredoxin subunit
MTTFLRNTWYVAAWADEVQPGQLLARRLLDQPIVLFRDAEGRARALMNRCPHRFVPLSMGKLHDGGNVIQCGYHGLRFDVQGRCVLNPQGGPPPPRAQVRSFPLVERYSALWIWMGDAEAADDTRIPDFSFMDRATHYVATASMVVAAHYELESDNILDLSHIEFLHPLFSSANVSRAPIECVIDGETVWSKRYIVEDELPEFLMQAFGLPAGARADRWLEVRWNAPACLALWSGGVRSGEPRASGRELPGAHLFTPESATSTHYFFGSGLHRSLGPDAEKAVRDAVETGASPEGPFHLEDKPMIEAQALAMGSADLWSMKPAMLSGDLPAARARRILAKMIEREGAAAAMSVAASQP